MKNERVFFWAVIALAFGLRMTGIGYGLPHLYHQDEPILVNHAMALGASGPNPHFFIIGPFSIYFLFLLYGLYFVAGSLAGFFADKNAFASAFLQDPTAFYLLGRMFLGALLGTATTALLYHTGRRFFSKETACTAAVLFAAAPLHVVHSHFIYADIPLTFAVLLFFYRTLCLAEAPSVRNALWAGAAAGLALSVKYTAAFFFPAALLAHVLVSGRSSLGGPELKRLALGGAAALAVFAVLAPYTFLDWPSFQAQVLQQSGAQIAVGWWHHFGYSLAGGTGVLFILYGAAGFIRTLASRERAWLIAGAFTVCYYAANVYFSQTFARYMLPLVPFAALWAAEGWRVVCERQRLGSGVRRFIFAALFLELFATAAYGDMLLLKKDTRTLCQEWIEREAKAGVVIAIDNHFFTPRLRQGRDQILQKYEWLGEDAKDAVRKMRLDLELDASAQGPAYSVYLLKPPAQASQTPKFLFDGPYAAATPAELDRLGVKYVIFNDTDFEPSTHGLKWELWGRMEKIAWFSPYFYKHRMPLDKHASTGPPHLSDELLARKRLGPGIKIYRVYS